MQEDVRSQKIRMAVFEWLEELTIKAGDVLPWQLLSNGFYFEGTRVPLIGAQGIWKPALMERYPISITTIPESAYNDKFLGSDRLIYHYRGTDPNHRDNVGLRQAMNDRIPLVYFYRVLKGKYIAHWPVFITEEDHPNRCFTVLADTYEIIRSKHGVGNEVADSATDTGRRRYVTSEVIVRLHQTSFREKVLAAYHEHCTLCNLKHRQLLDAAHIVPDSQGGEPIVQNGLALCKIHHAAYDNNFIGILPDYSIEIRKDILHETDGPMLKYGLQSLHKKSLLLPSPRYRPKKEFLDYRYQIFLNAI